MDNNRAVLSLTVFIHVKAWLKEKYGFPEYMHFVAWLQDNNFHELYNVFEAKGVLTSERINATVYRQLSESIIAYFGKGSPEIFKETAAYVTFADINSFLRTLIKVGTPTFIARQWPKAWAFYFSDGILKITKFKDKHVELELIDAEGYGLTACLAIQGWGEKSLELSGAKKAKVAHPECKFSGGSKCIFIATWEY